MFSLLKSRGRMKMKYNVAYELRDAEGNLKPIFQPNALMQYLVKNGHLSPHAPKIPFLFGHWSKRSVIANLVTTAGKGGVASRINGAGSEAVFDYIAIGEGTTAAAIGDTALESEISSAGGSRAQATASRTTTDTSNDTARLVNTFSFTGSFAVTESGVLNAGSGGTLLCRDVFSAINVENGDSLQITWDVDVD